MAENQIYCTSCGTVNATGARFCFKCGAPIQATEAPAPASRQSDFITLSCPNCGGKLEIKPDMERFACKYCGNEHLVRRSGGAVSLAPVMEGLNRVEGKFDQVLTGSDRMAAEHTINRLKAEIPELENRIAQKEVQVKNFGSRNIKSGLIISIILVVVGCIMTLCITVQLGMMFNSYYAMDWGDVEWWVWVVGLFGVSFALAGLIGLFQYAMSRKRWKETYEKARAELAQLKQDLKDRRRHLEELHHYTVER